MSAVAGIAARLFVKLRLLVIAAWIGGAVWTFIALPTISATGSRSASPLVPKHAAALSAERISAEQFGFPLVTRTLVVVRNPNGLSSRRQSQLLQLADRLSSGGVPGFGRIAGAIPLTNSVGRPPFVRERGTTVILYLYFRPTVSAQAQGEIAKRLVRGEIGQRPGEFEGVTGEAPGRAARATLITSHLKWIELATILLVALAIGIHFRALGAALLTILVVVMAYLLADRLVAELGRTAGLPVPAEVEPVLVVLVLGVATDYSVFFLSRFRGLVAQGAERREAAARVLLEIAPIVAVAGTTVAVGTAALLVARLGFLRAFGPGLAVAVMVSMVIAATLVPAVLGTFGTVMFWPCYPARADAAYPDAGPAEPVSPRRVASVRFAVRHPVLSVLVALVIVFGSATGLLRIALGNELILGLPPGATAHRAYDQAKLGFAPGVLDPTVVVVTGPAVGGRWPALATFQGVLAEQPGVAQVVGPAQRAAARGSGAMISRSGHAARYALILGSDPLGARAMADVRKLRGRLRGLLRRSDLADAHAAVGGDSALSVDTVHETIGDLGRVTPTVLAAIFLIVALFLRALIAPLYLVLTSALAALASLGLTVYVMQTLFGFGQITYYVIFVVAILLVALGSDYNVFLVARIWQEARHRSLRDAIEIAGSRAARPITTAGFVLALSFALLVIVPVRSFREIAFAMATGLIIDTFIVRTILVPALLALVGTRSAWPGHAIRTKR